jgi:hypothetical protein
MTGAVNQEIGRIARVQYYSWEIKNPSGERSIFDKPLEFEPWLLRGINYYEKDGTEFKTVCPGLMRIKRPGRPNLLRTLDDFKREYKGYK